MDKTPNLMIKIPIYIETLFLKDLHNGKVFLHSLWNSFSVSVPEEENVIGF